MNADRTTLRCPDPETIAALAEGRLESARVDAVLEHVEHCESCMDALDAANAVFTMQPHADVTPAPPARIAPRWWLAAAAVLAIGLGLFGIREWMGSRGTSIDTLVRLAPREVRLVEPRLSGGFAWAPYRGPMRAGGAVTDAERLRLGGAAADALDRAASDPSPAAQHVAGVAILLADDPSKAVERLRAASERAPGDARIAADLAAALYTAALALDRASLDAEALAAADRALRIDPRLPEALFNRALILDRLGLSNEARRAWERYLAVDPSSPWAEEARRRLARAPATSSERSFQRDVERLDPRTLARQYPQQSRTYAEGLYLGRWGEAVIRGDATEATPLLTLSRGLGEALLAATEEALLRDAVDAIDRADPERRTILARAHATYFHGRTAYAAQRLDDGERDLRASARDFVVAESPMALAARYFAACIRFDRHEAAARSELETLLRELGAHPAYTALRAQTQWELALCDMVENDWGAALAQLEQARTLFARLGERSNLAFIQSMLATTLLSLGRPEEAWTARAHAFEGLSAEGRGDRLAVAIGAAARMELRAGRFETARALLDVEVAEARAAGTEFMLSDALVRSALTVQEGGDGVAAAILTREAFVAANRIADPSLRERAVADARVADGAVRLADDPRHAIESLNAAIEFYQRRNLAAYLPAPYLYRARASLRFRDTGASLRDLDRGIAAADATVLDVRDSLFEDAIRLCLDRGDTGRAFAYAQRGQARTLDDLRQRLRGTATTVLHLTALPEEVVAFAVTGEDVAVTRTPFARKRLESETDLYDVLVRPSEHTLERNLIVIADARLQRVAFAALYDTRRRAYLVERVTVASAPSVAALEAFPEIVPRSVVAVALPSGARNASRRLPATESEPVEISRLYRDGRVIPTGEATYRAIRDAAASSDVVHIAGHTTRQGRVDDTALLLAGGERVSSSTIAAAPLVRRGVFVLAGCETLRSTTSPGVRSMSVGEAFIAAGAGSAIGTLAPIADEDAREIFLSVHRQLAAGASPAAAVRRVQLDAIASGRLPAWRSIALMTCCIRR